MILPNKYIKNGESLMGVSSLLLHLIKGEASVDKLWLEYRTYCTNEKIQYKVSFDNFLLAIDLLFIIGAITEVRKGIIGREIN